MEVNIKQHGKIFKDDNMTIEKEKTSERKVYTDLIDNDPKSENEENKEHKENKENKENIEINENILIKESKENIDNKENKKDTENLENKEKIKIIGQLNEGKNGEFIKEINGFNDLKTGMKRPLNDLNIIKRKNDENCCYYCCLMCLFFFVIIIFISINFFYLAVFIYYKNNCKECKAQLYSKLNDIIPLYLIMNITSFLTIINNLFLVLPFKCLKYYKCLGLILAIPLLLINVVLSIVNIVMIQKNYNKTKSWENCGNFKGWALSWLILNYFGMAFNFIKECCSSNRES